MKHKVKKMNGTAVGVKSRGYKSLLVLVLAVCGALTLGLTGCNRDVEVARPAKDKPLIGLAIDSLVVERWQRDMEIIVAQANEAGYEVNVQIANESISRQKDQINALIDEGVKVLIILPNDADALTEEVTRAKRQGIYVIAYDRLIKAPNVDLYLSFDNEGIGYEIGEYLLEKLPVKSPDRVRRLVMINGDPKDNNSALLNKGFHRAIEDQTQGPVEVVGEVWANEWRERFAQEAIQKALADGEKIDGVIAANDVLASGAIRILVENQLAGKVMVVSQDAELSACQRIVEGTQLATVYKPINDLAEHAVAAAVAHLSGEVYPTTETIDNGYTKVPYDKLSFQLVDKDNMDEVIIESGFHTKEDVYRHKP